jgi:Tfp pilus assembly protein PilZ
MESAKKCLVKLYQPDADSVKWRFLLNFLGVEATPLQDEKALIQTLLYDPAGLVIFDAALLGEAFAALGANCFHWLERGGGIALTGHAGLWPIPEPFHSRVTDISERDPFIINDLLRRFVPTYSRHQPRLETRLPCLYARGSGASQICEIVNLSPAGAFIRTTETLPLSGEELRVSVPLIGMHKEIELSSRVVRQVLPSETNNYAQGIVVSFIPEENSSAILELKNYARYVLAHDEALDPQITTFSGCRSREKGSVLKSLPAQSVKMYERVLAPIR